MTSRPLAPAPAALRPLTSVPAAHPTTRVARLAVPALLLSFACDGAPPPPVAPPPCEAPRALADSTNPLDRALAPAFASACLDLVAEDPAVLCRRLHADLLGRLPTAAEVASCVAAPLDQHLRRLQGEPRYLLQAERRWRDALHLDPELDWRYARRVFELVDDLHRARVRYDDFATALLAEPAVALSGFHAGGAFTVFLGRKASSFEVEDFGRLFALWQPAYRQSGPDNLDVAELGATLDPLACLAFGGCRTVLFGGGSVELRARPLSPRGVPIPIPFEDLDDDDARQLRVPGQLLARDPALWEAAADQLFDHLLGWDDREFVPRTPGALLPAVRRALADYLAALGDLPAAERLVLSSWLYRQRTAPPAVLSDSAAGALGDPRPVFAVGPLKHSSNEVLLDSMLVGASVDLGTCEPRYPMRHYRDALRERYALGGLDRDGLAQAFTKLRTLLAPRTPFIRDADGIDVPDLRFEDLAELLGGCGAGASAQGVYFALAHEVVVDQVCALAPDATASVDALLTERMNLHLARAPTPDEATQVRDALSGCDDACTGRAQVEGVCSAVLGSAELLFY